MKTNTTRCKRVRTGDKILCMGAVVTIGKILYQEYFDDWDIEFIDTAGYYRHWKQYFDGGQLIRKKKRAYDWYGTDVTDLYAKYGQPI